MKNSLKCATVVAAMFMCASITHAQTATFVQVNVNSLGQDIVGDAANEPSIAVDPTNPNRMAIGWRQFNTINSNFRQAGVAYTTNGGQTWTASVLQPGQFRSDPVLRSDADGNFYFASLNSATAVNVLSPSMEGRAGANRCTRSAATRSGWRSTRRTARAAGISTRTGTSSSARCPMPASRDRRMAAHRSKPQPLARFPTRDLDN